MVEGPLDIVRRIGEEAEELDELAMGDPDLGESELYGDFMRTVFRMDNFHPLMHDRVIIYGTPLTLSAEMDDSSKEQTVHPLAIGVDREYRPGAGVYKGLTVLRPYDTAEERYVYRVAHILELDSSDPYIDDFGHMHYVVPREYILSKGSEVVPYNPVNAHSFEDMKSDPVVSMIDDVAYGNSQSAWQAAEEIGLNVAVALNEREDEDDRNQQRLSYLNSLGLLEEVEVVTDDFMFGDKYDYETNPNLKFNMQDSFFVVAPHAFHFLNGYERMQPSGAIAFGREPELFMEGTLDDGQVVILPFQSIEGGYDA